MWTILTKPGATRQASHCKSALLSLHLKMYQNANPYTYTCLHMQKWGAATWGPSHSRDNLPGFFRAACSLAQGALSCQESASSCPGWPAACWPPPKTSSSAPLIIGMAASSIRSTKGILGHSQNEPLRDGEILSHSLPKILPKPLHLNGLDRMRSHTAYKEHLCSLCSQGDNKSRLVARGYYGCFFFTESPMTALIYCNFLSSFA